MMATRMPSLPFFTSRTDSPEGQLRQCHPQLDALEREGPHAGWEVRSDVIVSIEDPLRPGRGFVHFAAIQNMTGYRELKAGEEVEYEWDGYPNGQDGCEWRAAWVRLVQSS
jgi:hypothetical protein